MELHKLEKLLRGEPKYRYEQALVCVFRDLIEDWSGAVVLPGELREKLKEKFLLGIKAETLISEGGNSAKARIILKDGVMVESILMRYEGGRNTVCVSSQAGCSLGCVFCATGKSGFKRNLTEWEIVLQVLFFARLLKKEKERITNIVFMGMGEPFLNYENVMSAIRILNDKKLFNIGARSISVSTAGIPEGIEKFSNENLQVNLALSLHATDNDLRSRIMPINEKYPLEAVLKSVDSYIEKTNRKVMMEYLLIDGVNDSDECAQKLSELAKKPLYFLNIILYNPTGDFKAPPKERIKRFKEILWENGVQFSERYRFGRDVKGGCGQFTTF